MSTLFQKVQHSSSWKTHSNMCQNLCKAKTSTYKVAVGGAIAIPQERNDQQSQISKARASIRISCRCR